jgi:hypothetical protein
MSQWALDFPWLQPDTQTRRRSVCPHFPVRLPDSALDTRLKGPESTPTEPACEKQLASIRFKATGTPELASTVDALKLDDTVDAVVGPPA